jgi:endonuclease G
MADYKLFNGFDTKFFNDQHISVNIDLPTVNGERFEDIATINDSQNNVLNYVNYSVQLSSSRKFPIYTAANIDGTLFKKASRSNNWRKDERAKEFQWGQELYSAAKSDFDKGHMTKREDVQWGETPGIAQIAADSTFFYSNAVPQHKDLNQKIWRSLEDYILHTETKKNNLKVCVFTGPVLSSNDPTFVTEVNDQKIKIPIMFWKVVYYPKNDGNIYRVGFMMSQNRLLIEHNIVLEPELEVATDEDLLFMQFDDAETYQVNVSLIEQISELNLFAAIDSYTDTRSKKLVLKEIDIDPDLEIESIEQFLGYSIENLTL